MNTSPPFDFEAALAKLEGIVTHMERDRLNVDDAITQFEQGISLVRACQTALTQAEQRIQMLLEQNGQPSLVDYQPED